MIICMKTQNKRMIKEVKAEIKQLRETHEERFGRRKIKAWMPFLMSPKELESLAHIQYVEGYLQAMRDERKKK